MNIKKILKISRGLLSPSPIYLIFFITSRCNARCHACFDWKSQEREGKDDLTLDEIQRIACSFDNLLHLNLTGGEPFLRQDIYDIIRIFHKATGVDMITIPSNGFLTETITRKMQEILREFPDIHFNLTLSMDGIGEKHDELRQVPGAFKMVSETFLHLREIKQKFENLSLNIAVLLSAFNQDDIVHTIKELHRRFEPDQLELILARGDCRSRGDFVKKENYAAAASQVLKILKAQTGATRYPALYKSLTSIIIRDIWRFLDKGIYPYPCAAGKKLIVIRADGRVDPCEMLEYNKDFETGYSLGNIKNFDYNIKRVLNTSIYENILENIDKKGCRCSFECALFAGRIFRIKNFPMLFYRMFFPMEIEKELKV